LPDQLRRRLQDVASALAPIIFQGEIPTKFPGNRAARSVNTARQRLHGLIKDPALPAFLEALDEVYARVARREFPSALTAIDELPVDASLAGVTEGTVAGALRFDQLTFTTVDEVEVTPNKPPVEVEVEVPLPGYAGPRLSPEEVRALLELAELVSGGKEFVFRTTLLRAECHAAVLLLGELEAAVRLYRRLLPPAFRPPPARRRSVAVRLALAHLRIGDLRYRAADDADASARAQARSAYHAATRVLTRHRVPRNHPLGREIARHARLQQSKLGSGLNFLGYRDTYVPVLRPERLRQVALEHSDRAVDAVSTSRRTSRRPPNSRTFGWNSRKRSRRRA
jgi:hypothetical protein